MALTCHFALDVFCVVDLPHCSADPMNSEERVVVEHVEALGLSVVSFFLFRLGGGASGANFVVTSHALKKSETVKQ